MTIRKTLERIAKTALIGGMLLFNPIQASAQDAETLFPPVEESSQKAEPYLMAQGIADFNFFDFPIAKIKSVPEYMRDVPAHLDDGGGKVGAIKDDSYALIPERFEVRAGAGIRVPKFDFSLGVKAGFECGSGGGHERNYTNAPGTEKRGYGAALTYYGVGFSRFDIGAFAKASFFADFFGMMCNFLSAEYSIDISAIQSIDVGNGWDRWDEYEPKDTYYADFQTINHTLEIISGDLNFGAIPNTNIKIFFGAKIPQIISESELAKQMGLVVLPCFYGGIKFEYGADTLEDDH